MYKLLWADDEIELLRAHILFLERKGYAVATVASGIDAVEQCRAETFDLILLDEMMPGLSGLETLQRIKEVQPQTPVVMVTKSEEENIMDQAIGQQIADYLIKPVNPSQILLALKKHIHRREIVSEVTQTRFRQAFATLSAQIDASRTVSDWQQTYRSLVEWELTLSDTDAELLDVLRQQKQEANAQFAKFIKREYLRWVDPRSFTRRDLRPRLSPDIFRESVLPALDHGPVTLIVIDNLRYDQWLTMKPLVAKLFDISDELYLSILPTATQYARNSIFSGLMPEQIERLFPELWVDEDSEEGKNVNEEPLIRTQLERFRRAVPYSYAKVNDAASAERYVERIASQPATGLRVLVVNFIDMLSHARTESKALRELVHDEAAYRQLTLAWFRRSPIATLLERLADRGERVIITTDHGTLRVSRPVKIIGDRNTNTNLRYKLGRNLNTQSKDVFTITEPRQAQLPQPNISTSYVFAAADSFFAYPNNYNYYVSHFKDTFQHGGISMEEMLVPLATLTPRR